MDGERFQPGDLVAARGREWVVLPSVDEHLLKLRPLSGSEEDAQVLAPALENPAVRHARFLPPRAERPDTQDAARLLADALRLSMRRGAGPFRSAAHLGVEPRAYQLVPLMMALKLPVVRMLIADDVGIGKTIEAGLIVREMLDRGAIDRLAVLCPPHLVDQWVRELGEKFDLDAVAVTASGARRLERGLPTAQSLFEAFPFTVVSLDYIKADSRRDEFARACPEAVIVDEAHSCVGGERGRHQRYELLHRLSQDSERHLLFLTATPHSGDEDAFRRLLALIHEDFTDGPDAGDQQARERYARRLAQHFVQRRRADIVEGGWAAGRAFPRHLSSEATFSLAGDYASFQEDVLDYCVAVTQRAGSDERGRRLAFWGTLALMRCVGSSPAAAASALRNRLGGKGEGDTIEPLVLDGEEGLLTESDVEPGTASDGDEEEAALRPLIEAAEALDRRREEDPKLRALVRHVKLLIEREGARPIVFCRFIATAEAVGEVLRKRFPKHEIAVVSGRLTPEERRARVEAMGSSPARILVATDCLSEGVNLQALFDAVIHYDLSWNPTRHQQREGRVDRFGQQAPTVHTLMIYGENSMIDGAVLEVITRKAEAIRKATGVSVPIPSDSDGVANALMQAMLLRSRTPRAQGVFDFSASGDRGGERIETLWHDVEADARASRARYAQGAMRPEEVLPEWHAIRALTGGPVEVERFTRRALKRLNTELEPAPDASGIVNVDQLPEAVRLRLQARGLTGAPRVRFSDDPSPGVMHVGRAHPLVATLAETLAESALDAGGDQTNALGRCGAWRTGAVSEMVTLLLLRLRFQLVASGRSNRLLLAEEATGIAFGGLSATASLTGAEALALLETEASADIDPSLIVRRVSQALERLELYQPAIDSYAAARAIVLSADHQRLTSAARGGATVEVSPVLPSDVIGLYVLLPEAG